MNIVPSTNIGTLDQYEQRLLWKKITQKKKNHKILTYHWSKTIESGEKSWNKCFLQWMLATIIGTLKNCYE